MNRRITSITFAGLSLTVAFASCGGSGGSSPASPTNTAPAVISTPYPPAPTPTATPTPFPAPQTLGNVACTAADNAVPGLYFTITSSGSAVGNTYTSVDGQYNGFLYAVGPTPPPYPTPRPIPSAVPGGPNYLWIAYFGTFTFPIYPSVTTVPTSGCFELVTQQQLGQSVGEHTLQPLPQSSASAVPFAYGVAVGIPAFASPQPGPTYVPGVDYSAGGNFTAFTITNLTRTTGNGSFTTDFGGTGTVTITGSTLSFGAGSNAAAIR